MQQTKTTVHLRLPDPRHLSVPAPISVAICVICMAGIIASIGRIQSTGSAAAVPTASLPAAIIIIASPVAQIPPTAVPIQVAAVVPTVRWVTAWAAPDGVVLGPIPAPPASAIVARYGDGWYMTYHDGAPVWVRASELGMQIADIAPAPEPQVVYVSSQEAPGQAVAPEPSYQSAPTPAALYGVLSERQQRVQNRMVQPMPPSPPDDVTRALMQEAWRQEHCVGGVCR